MTTFEKELRKLFDHDAIFSDTRFVGRTCYGKISDSLRIRAEFVTLGHANHYEALKVSLINRNEGVTQSSGLDRHAVFSRQRSDKFSENHVIATQSARQHKDATDLVCQPEIFGQSQYGNYAEGCAIIIRRRMCLSWEKSWMTTSMTS